MTSSSLRGRPHPEQFCATGSLGVIQQVKQRGGLGALLGGREGLNNLKSICSRAVNVHKGSRAHNADMHRARSKHYVLLLHAFARF